MRHTAPLVACVNLGLGRFAPLCKRRHHTIPVLFIGAPPNLQKHLVIEHSTIPVALNCNAGHDWTISHYHRYITLTVLQGIHSLVNRKSTTQNLQIEFPIKRFAIVNFAPHTIIGQPPFTTYLQSNQMSLDKCIIIQSCIEFDVSEPHHVSISCGTSQKQRQNKALANLWFPHMPVYYKFTHPPHPIKDSS